MENPQRFDDSTIYKQPSSCSLRKLADAVPARVVLYMLSFSGFLVSFMMRMDINLAIVAMAKSTTTTSGDGNNTSSSSTQPHCSVATNASLSVENTTIIPQEELGEFDWSTGVQSAIIGSFYWCYILSQIVGGVLTQYFGTKTVFGVSQLLTAVCSLLIPTAADIHYGAMIALRSIQGAASGLTWPAMYAIVGHWIPPAERSRFMSSFQARQVCFRGTAGYTQQRPLNSMRMAESILPAWLNQSGPTNENHMTFTVFNPSASFDDYSNNRFSIGIGLTYPLCGFLIAHFGWRVVFYTTGSIGTAWCVLWYFFAYDTPAAHPRISQQERRYIQGSVGDQVLVGNEGMPVPWKAIFTSWPAWSIGITTFGRIWVHYVFIVPGPMYMNSILGFDIQTNGILSGLPFISSYFASVVFCYVADLLVTRQIFSLITVRKICTATAQVIPGILLIIIGYLGCSVVLVLIIWFIAVTLITAAYAGAMANIVDIAPNLAGPVLAFAQTIHMTASFLSPIVAGLFTNDGQSLDAWRKVFGVSGCIACGTYVVYQIFGTADIQAWNYPDQKYPQSVREDSQPLRDSPRKNGKIIPNGSSVSQQA